MGIDFQDAMASDFENEYGGSSTFSAVEELDEAARALGWNIEYRQMGRGAFRPSGPRWSATESAWPRSEPTTGCTSRTSLRRGSWGSFFCGRPGGRAQVCGQALREEDLVVFPAGSEMEIVTRDEMRNETLFMPEAKFLVSARLLAPAVKMFAQRSAAICRCDPVRVAEIEVEIDTAQRRGVLDSESASKILLRTILQIADASGRSSAERLANGVVARRAQSYIEENLRYTIRMEDLCADCGVGLRTLQRCFAAQF